MSARLRAGPPERTCRTHTACNREGPRGKSGHGCAKWVWTVRTPNARPKKDMIGVHPFPGSERNPTARASRRTEKRLHRHRPELTWS